MEHSGNIPIFSMPGTFFGNIPRDIGRELFPDIAPRILHEHIFARWDVYWRWCFINAIPITCYAKKL